MSVFYSSRINATFFYLSLNPKYKIIGTGATKLDSLKDELEEAEAKVELCRDQLAAEMFQLMSRETELAQIIIQYVKLQRAYHESALHYLEDFIPGLESYISKSLHFEYLAQKVSFSCLFNFSTLKHVKLIFYC